MQTSFARRHGEAEEEHARSQITTENILARQSGPDLMKKFGAIKREFLLKKRRVMEFGVRPYLLRSKIKHIHGPQKISYALDELLVISVVRNGELYIKSFTDHYRSMGVKHFVFLDNGSTDHTLKILCGQKGVTVLQTDAPYNKYENTMKRYLAERFSPGRWNLCADIDELFDYPFSKNLCLSDFLGYLNENKYTAVVTQMLDMFSNIPLNKLESKPDDALNKKYIYYDISSIEKEDYLWSERSNPAIKMHWGGIRKMVFGTINGLTKSALVLMDGRVKPFITWHHAKGARMADISCLLRHYPFVSSFYAKVKDAVRTGRYGMKVTDEYKMYAKSLNGSAGLNFKLKTAQQFTGVERLIEYEFLIISEKYRQWVDDHARGSR
jgi:glycosyl transferase family 2